MTLDRPAHRGGFFADPLQVSFLQFLVFALALLPPGLAAEDHKPPELRLPEIATPLRYRVHLNLAPDQDSFSGSIDMDLKFNQSSSILWLNADKLKIKEASIEAGGQTQPATVLAQPADFAGFSFDHPVAPGPAVFHVRFEGEISRKDMQGIFQVKDGEHWYVYSQFEYIGARRAFPCFDEPAYKVPWQVTLTVPKGDGAFSNTPQLSEDVSGDSKTVQFAETRPLPSYLVALSIGPMKVVEAAPAGKNHTPIRIIVPTGRESEAQVVASVTPDVVNLLEKYFGIPYPYPKLDEVAIPFAGFAMENAGLVTYGSIIFLMKPEDATVVRKRELVSVVAHELAHQWFGDLVTTAWWDDIWLNEGFASWMANKIVNEYHPEWKMNIDELNGYQSAMSTDALLSSRKVRQEIKSNDDIANAFDDITYNKGSALLNMFESYLGPQTFQARVRQYLEKYSWGSATSAQFLAALSGDSPTTGQAFSTFLDQAGVPLITPKLTCNGQSAELELTQRRFLPRGSQGSSDQLWMIPVCVRYPGAGGDQRTCSLMQKKSESMALTRTSGCPAWVYVNADQAGYYRVLYDDSMRSAILKETQSLTLPERVGMIGDIAAFTNGYVPLGTALALAPTFAHDSSGAVVRKTLGIVSGLEDHYVTEDVTPNYRRYLSDLYGKRAQALGWKDQPGEDVEVRLLRPALLETIADEAEDEQSIQTAKKLANALLNDHQAIDPEMLGVVLGTAASHGDQALFDRLHAAARSSTNELEQAEMLYALGSFRDPAIVKKALPLTLGGEFDNRRVMSILFGADNRFSRDIVYAFVKQNWSALIDKLPNDAGAYLAYIGAGYCDAEHRADIEPFFKDRSAKTLGGPRVLDQVLESVDHCIAKKKENQAGVVEFLRKY
ncbi:MAG TPA: M1 family aminopeptidase [Terracidiphilus sp.]